MFKEAATDREHTDVEECALTVCAYILKCSNLVGWFVTKTAKTRAKDKPWMTKEV